MKMAVRPGTVVVFTDVVCGWSTVALHRFYQARKRLGLTDKVRIDHQLFLLEDVNRFAIPKRLRDSEIRAVGTLAPEFGWKPWQGDASTWPRRDLEDGTARAEMMRSYRRYSDDVQGSPHFFLSDEFA